MSRVGSAIIAVGEFLFLLLVIGLLVAIVVGVVETVWSLPGVWIGDVARWWPVIVVVLAVAGVADGVRWLNRRTG